MERVKLRKSVNGLFTCGMSLKTNLVPKLQRQNSVTANAVYCHRRRYRCGKSKFDLSGQQSVDGNPNVPGWIRTQARQHTERV